MHAVLLDYLNECNEEDKGEIIAAFLPHIAALASTKDGVHAAMLCFWHSIVKDRRVSFLVLIYEGNELLNNSLICDLGHFEDDS